MPLTANRVSARPALDASSGRTIVALATLLAAGATAWPIAATAQADGAQDAVPAVESNLPSGEFVARGATIELRVSGVLQLGERLAVLLGSTDATSLFQPVPGGLRYTPRVVSLPAGEQEMTVYLVRASGEWVELRRFPLLVRSGLGYDRGSVTPVFDLGLEGQLAEGHDASTPPPPRRTYQDFTGQLAFESSVERGSAAWSTQASLIGVSHQESTLRYGELAGRAPRVDLSNYAVRFNRGPQELSVGHVSLGDQRHLISGFASRGATIALRPASRMELRGGLMNGTSVVGWYNPFGLNDPGHRIASGSFAVEALPRAGGMRLEFTGLTGSVRPFAGYNQGVVNDAEESRGLGLRLIATDPSQRLRLESGYARSRFDNPLDSTLAQGGALVAVQPVTRNAHYVDAALDVVRDLQLGSRTAGLALGYRRERVDPLYRSLGAFAQPDRESNHYEVRATVAGVALLGSHARTGDNLGNLASVLTTQTKRTGIRADVPLAGLVGATAMWLPVLSYGVDRTHQFGEGIPDNGEFAESHIPDQISTNRTLSAEWQLGRAALGYRWNSSLQDNRQAGRDNADFDALANGVTLGVTAASWLNLDLSFDAERAASLESREVDRTRRYSGRTTLRPFGQSTLTLSAAHTRTADDVQTRRRRDTVLDGHWSSLVPGMARLGTRYYLRFSRTSGRSLDQQFDLDQSTSRWSLSSGLNMGINPFSR